MPRSGCSSWPPAWSPSCPTTLAAVEAGRIDLARAEVLAQETALLDDAGARAVEALVLAKVADADGPWQTLSPRGWKSQIQRLVIRVDADAARRRREQALRERAVRAWPQGDGTGVLQIIGQDCDIAFADRVLTNLALAAPSIGPDGEKLSMDQRRVDGFMDLMRRVAFGDQLPQARTGGQREVGIVVHADTLFGDGPAKNDPGELRGLGAPAPIDPTSAAGAGPRRDRRRRRHPGPARRRRRCPAAHHPAAQSTAGWLDPRPARRPSPHRLPGPARPADRVLRTHRGDHRPRPSRAPPVHLL